MTYVNKYDKGGKCSEDGHSAEDLFEDMAIKRGYKTRRSSRKDNMHKHIDIYLEGQESGKAQEVSVDIKARKRVSRKDKKFNDDWTWIEMKNVQGKDGWIYGEADFIAFERAGDFIMTPRKKVIELIQSKVRFDLGFVDRAAHAKYKVYQRKGRRDQITQVKMSDILMLKNITIWPKAK